MKKIVPEKIAAPGGHYTPGILSNGILYVSGQLPINEEGNKFLGSIEEQTLQVLLNMRYIVEAAGGTIEDVAQVTIYISDGKYWADVNKVYADFFGDHKPARAIVPVKELHFGFLIELAAIADIPA